MAYCSTNYDERATGSEINILLFHYTGMENFQQAIKALCDDKSKLSAHYIIDENGETHSLVPENKRAWHAGASFWAGLNDINSYSIGIEIVNGGHEYGLPDFKPQQMRAVQLLAAAINSRYNIKHFLGHSDVAPERKADPGEKFDWRSLAQKGLGFWIDPPPLDENYQDIKTAHVKLTKLGYNPNIKTEILLKAFQRHWRPRRIDGRLDNSTAITIDELLKLV